MQELITKRKWVAPQLHTTTLSSIWTTQLNCNEYPWTVAKYKPTQSRHKGQLDHYVLIALVHIWQRSKDIHRQFEGRFVLKTKRHIKMTSAIPMWEKSSMHMGNIFRVHWIILFCTLSCLLTRSGPQFVSKFITRVCGDLGAKHLTTTTYHAQTSGQAKRFPWPIVTRIRHYVSKHQKDGICIYGFFRIHTSRMSIGWQTIHRTVFYRAVTHQERRSCMHHLSQQIIQHFWAHSRCAN